MSTIFRDEPSQRSATSPPDSFSQTIELLRSHPREMWLELARIDQSQRWRGGAGIAAEEYFARLPEFRECTEDSLVLICGEAQLRSELGESPNLEEYQQRFPILREELAIQFEVDSLFRNENDTAANGNQADGLDSANETFSLPGYEFENEIGRGAAGVVYRARQISLDRPVAVKVLGNPGQDARRSIRQHQEAQILARLTHPNVVHIYEVLYHHGHVHLVMELIDGPTLREDIDGRPLAAREAAGLVATMAETVHAVHEAGVLHRDLKPANVLLTADGQPKISDFGLAKLRVDDSLLTTQDAILGTPSYMSPEQALGNAAKIGPATDVYSLGAVLYELLTGRAPFLGVTILDTLSLIRERDPVAPRQLQPKTPRDLETICLKCLQKQPTDRYPSARELANDLRRFLSGEAILACPPAPIERLSRFVRRKPAIAFSAFLAATLLGVVGFSASRLREQQHQLSATALVDAVATADSQTLPRLLDRLTVDADRTLPLVQSRLNQLDARDDNWLNLALAELTVDPQAPTGQLLVYLPEARPAEVGPIATALAARGAEIKTSVWQLLLANTVSDEQQLRLACLAAKFDPTDDRWQRIAQPVIRALVRQHPLDIGTFTSALLPARDVLAPVVVAIVREGHLDAAERRAAMSIVARYATEEAATLVELATSAEPEEFRLIYPAIARQADAAMPVLSKIATANVRIVQFSQQDSWKSPHEIERAFDAAQGRRATAAIALWRLGDPEIVENALASGGDPELRAWLIEQIVPLGVPAMALQDKIVDTDDVAMRQACILAIGQADFDSLPQHALQQLNARIAFSYVHDADPGVHAACRWLLDARLNNRELLNDLDEQLELSESLERMWRHGPNRHLFSNIRVPKDFRSGSPKDELWRETDETPRNNPRSRTIAVAIYETTVAQYRKFRPRTGNSFYAPEPDCPINNTTWFDAAAYCRWLSELDGIAEDQMVYPPLEEIKPGMRLPANWQDRTGYRLPNEVEWEYACRANTKSARYCGDGIALLRQYAWYLNYSDDRALPVGKLKPNDFGLFDTLGNVAERCHQQGNLPASAESSGEDPSTPSSSLVINSNQGTARGGEFADVAQNIRAARVYGVPASAEWGTVGFRVVRTIAAEELRP